MRFLNLYLSVLINAFFMFSIVGFVHADSIDNIRVIKISPKDERAIIKTHERELKIIKVGDILQVKRSYQRSALGSQQRNEQLNKIVELKVVEIVKGRVVFEEETEQGTETIIIRIEDENSSKFKVQSSKLKKQTVERIKKTADKEPVLYKTNHE